MERGVTIGRVLYVWPSNACWVWTLPSRRLSATSAKGPLELDAATYWTLDSTGNWALLDGRYGSADDCQLTVNLVEPKRELAFPAVESRLV